MSQPKEQPNLFTYLDRITGVEGIKTSNKIDLGMDKETKLFLVGVGIGLVVFSQLLRVGLNKLTKQ